MFNSTVLEVAVGLVFCYAAVALLTSSLTEAIASGLRLRAKSLLAGIKELVNDPGATGIALKLYNHALISPRGDGKATNESELTNLPAYIPSADFASALIDTLQAVPGDAARLKSDIDQVSDTQLRQLLQGMYARSGGQIDRLQQELASWFDNGMDRVAGAYKRQAQKIAFVIGLAVAVTFCIDSVYLFRNLWLHPALAAALQSSEATKALGATIDQLQTLPIGWTGRAFDTSWEIASAVLGLLITASSALFGAPFGSICCKTWCSCAARDRSPPRATAVSESRLRSDRPRGAHRRSRPRRGVSGKFRKKRSTPSRPCPFDLTPLRA